MCRGQGDLWEDPGQGRPWQGPPPANTAQLQPPPPPPAAPAEAAEAEVPAFDLDEELAALEKETKVRSTSEPV